MGPRPAQHPTKWPPKTLGVLPEWSSEDGLTYQGYLGPSWPRFWRVLGSTLCLLRPYLAPTWRPRSLQSRPRAHKSCPREPKIVQEPPKTAQDSPRASQDGPGAAREPPKRVEELPKTAQEPPKSRPRCPGAAQDLTRAPPRSCQEPGPKPRNTYDLKRTPNFTTQSFRTLFQTTKRPTSKTSGGGTPPKGVFNTIPPAAVPPAAVPTRGLFFFLQSCICC